MGSLLEQFGTLPPAPDRRSEPRTTPASLTQVELGHGQSGVVLNISEGGMTVAVAHAFAVGQHIPRILFQLPGAGSSSQSVEISAEIVWVSESKKGAGMRFVGISADALDRISGWIARERSAPEFAHLPKPVRRNRQPLPINSGRSRTIFSRDAIGNDDAGARYAKMFPSENASPRITAVLDEIRNEEEPEALKAVAFHPEDKPPAVSMGSFADATPPLTATSANEGDHRSAPAPIPDANRDRREALTPDKAETQPTDSKIEVSPSSADGSSSNLDPPAKSPEKGFKLQFAIFGFVLVAISFILGLTAGYAPIEKRLRSFGRHTRPSAITPSATPAVPPAAPSEATSPAAPVTTLDAPPMEAPSSDEKASLPENQPASSRSPSSNSPVRATPPPPSTPSSIPSKESKSKKNTSPAETTAPAHAKTATPSPTIESKKPKPKAEAGTEQEEQTESTSPSGESAPPAAPSKTEPVAPSAAAGSASEPSPDPEPAARSATPPARPAPSPRPAAHPAPIPANVVIPAAENGKLVRAVLPRKSIADSPELGITSQLSVVISPAERAAAGDHETARLQAGGIITYVVPHQPKPGNRYNSAETIKVRATIGPDGRVTDVKPINGPIFLLASVTSAVRQWRFHPTLLNGRPVQAQDDVTIEFRQQR